MSEAILKEEVPTSKELELIREYFGPRKATATHGGVTCSVSSTGITFGILLSGDNEHQGMVAYSPEQVALIHQATGEYLAMIKHVQAGKVKSQTEEAA
ncbi:MAG: hypothetical protein GY799_13380 [Desulfobulbaceae bacterium]|nr:hypothetical protein [Desulfobulbaceae bacterium]